MAKGTRDVSLVIRAKNEASKSLSAVSAALRDLRQAQDGAAKGSERTGSTIERLGAVLNKVDRGLATLEGARAFSQSMEQAEQSIGKLETQINGLIGDQQRLAQETDKVRGASERFNARQAELAQTLEKQKKATAGAGQDLQKLTTEIERNAATVEKRNASGQKFVDRLTKQQAALERTQTRYRQLAQEILRTEKPSNRLIGQFERTEAQLQKQSGALARTETDYRTHQQQIDQLQQALPALRREEEALARAFARAEADQQRTVRALARVGRASSAAEQRLRELDKAARSTGRSMSVSSRQLSRAKGDLDALQASGEKAGQEMEELGAAVRGQMLRSLREAKAEVIQFREEWDRARAAASRSVTGGAGMGPGGMGPPTPLAAADTQRQIELARLAKQAYQEQQAAAHRLQQELRKSGTDVNALRDAQQAYAAALEKVKTATEAIVEAQKRHAQTAKEVAVNSGQAAAATDRRASASRRGAAAHRENAASARENATAMDMLNRRGRHAMTWAQRLRGEVIALTLSYVGLFSAIQQLRGVTNAFMQIEAAQNRMLVAFNGNDALSAREMRWVREEADRLGIQFGVLAGEYSKFAIATRGTNIEGAETRRIFKAVSEAARVNKLTTEQMQGTFLALSQIVNKGVVSMEELRRQMGERLYGAFTLAAEAMGITTAELDKLVSSGSLVSERFLPKFATRLEEVFGPHLAASLDTFTTDLGRFQNEILKTQLRVAGGGFIDGLRDALNSLSEFFKSDDGKRFFEVLGAAAGGLVRVIAEIPQHFKQIAFILAFIVGMRAASTIGTLADRFKRVLAVTKPLPVALNASTKATRGFVGVSALMNRTMASSSGLLLRYQSHLRSTTALFTTVTGRAALLARTMHGLKAAMAFVGGAPGLIVTGLSLALATWVGRTGDVVDITGQHQEQMHALLDEYSRVTEEAGDWAKAIEDGIGGITLDQARKTFRGLVEKLAQDADVAFEAVAGRVERAFMLDSGAPVRELTEVEQKVVDLIGKLRAGELTARDYQKALNEILKRSDVPEALRKLIENAGELTQAWVESEDMTLRQAAVVKELGGELGELLPILQALVPSFEEMARAEGLIVDGKTVDAIGSVNRQLTAMREEIPRIKDELDLLEKMKGLDEILRTAEALEGVESLSEPLQRLHAQRLAQLREYTAEAKQALQDAFDAKRFQDGAQALGEPGADSRELSARLLRQREGFQPTGKWDVNAFRAGFGSDTIELADGTIKAITEGMRVSVEDADRDLERRIGESQQIIRRQIGDERWMQFSAQQQAVLTSNAYNYGSLTNGDPKRQDDNLLDAVRAGTTEGIVAALRGQGNNNEGVNRERREEEAFLFGQSGQISAEANLKFAEQQLEASKQLAERAAEYNEQLDRTLARRAEDLEYVDGISREMAVGRALEDERLRAARIGVTLSQEQLELIRANAAAAWDQQAAEEAIRREKEHQAEGEQELNRLQQHRRDLMEQIAFYEKEGDHETVTALKEQLNEINDLLDAQIDKWIAYWETVGGPEAAAKIAALESLKIATADVKTELDLLTPENLGKTFGEHLGSGMDNFLAKIRETGDVLGSLRESFLQFASDFLLKIAQMILRQAIFNALQSSFGAGAGGFWGGVMSGIAGQHHDGGIAGQATTMRAVSPAWFTNAMRYHSGGIAGLKPGEVPAVLERGEEVLTRDDPRHVGNGGGQGSGPPIKIINTLDPAEVVAAGMNGPAGERIFENYLSRNRAKVKQIIG